MIHKTTRAQDRVLHNSSFRHVGLRPTHSDCCTRRQHLLQTCHDTCDTDTYIVHSVHGVLVHIVPRPASQTAPTMKAKRSNRDEDGRGRCLSTDVYYVVLEARAESPPTAQGETSGLRPLEERVLSFIESEYLVPWPGGWFPQGTMGPGSKSHAVPNPSGSNSPTTPLLPTPASCPWRRRRDAAQGAGRCKPPRPML